METEFAAQTGANAPGTIRLRGHHFLCLLTYKGLGYTPAFVKNLSRIAQAINDGTPVMLAQGPDDICNGLSLEDRLRCGHDCEKESVYRRDAQAIAATAPLLDLNMNAPFILTANAVKTLRAAFASGQTRAGCVGCPWVQTCDNIAADGFAGTILLPADTE
ncbi:DUF1284 domain-containing protein [Rhizobium sp. L1K21]|uniref:DUF1284 domain-containing protein n=1 Tax=Rhizobium sp. L1K21 TaxID=2954933 RepID=UPI002093A5E7|nr:DUF1284 domain-containing protein [Rhizobium sp. L1K21]MCO6186867.1 DUF1284 domain-containing protein [Rhizobium sp. L1K21]